MMVAEADTQVIGFTAWLPYVFVAFGRTYRAMRSVDMAVLPERRGQGVASAITRAGTENMPGDTSFAMSNPNDMSIGLVRRAGRREVGRFPRLVCIRRPLRVALGRRRSSSLAQEPVVHAPSAIEVLADDAGVASLLDRVQVPGDRLSPLKDIDYLRWRYLPHGYHAISDEVAGQLRGLAVFRMDPNRSTWNINVCELLVADDDAQAARRLLRSVLKVSTADSVTCRFPAHTVQQSAARRCGFIRMGFGDVGLFVFPVDPTVRPDPTEVDSWALTLGDFELL